MNPSNPTRQMIGRGGRPPAGRLRPLFSYVPVPIGDTMKHPADTITRQMDAAREQLRADVAAAFPAVGGEVKVDDAAAE
jgi:hypothetical protein